MSKEERDTLDALVAEFRRARDVDIQNVIYHGLETRAGSYADASAIAKDHCADELEATLQRLSREVENDPKPPSPFCYDVQRCAGLRSCPKGRACNE